MNFLSYLPEIERIARYHFRRHHDREEMVDRVRTRMWERWIELERDGILTDHFVRMQLSFSIRAVKCGRRLEGSSRKGTDALDHKVDEDFREIPVIDDLDPVGTVVAKDLHQVYRSGIKRERKRQIFDRIVEGATNSELSLEFGIGHARCSQYRAEFRSGIEAL